MVIVTHLSKILILFQKFQENYLISILDSITHLLKKSIEISTKFKFNEWVYAWNIKKDILTKNINYKITHLIKILFHTDILYT